MDMICCMYCNTKPESSKVQRKIILKKLLFSFLLFIFFLFGMSPSGNLVIAIDLLITYPGHASSNVSTQSFDHSVLLSVVPDKRSTPDTLVQVCPDAIFIDAIFIAAHMSN